MCMLVRKANSANSREGHFGGTQCSFHYMLRSSKEECVALLGREKPLRLTQLIQKMIHSLPKWWSTFFGVDDKEHAVKGELQCFGATDTRAVLLVTYNSKSHSWGLSIS
jgi:hypothetical protein